MSLAVSAFAGQNAAILGLNANYKMLGCRNSANNAENSMYSQIADAEQNVVSKNLDNHAKSFGYSFDTYA